MYQNNNKFLKNPHQNNQQLGKLTISFVFKQPKDFPATCVAMARVANIQAKDDEAKSRGNDDYSMSLKALMDAFDTFIKEYSKGKMKTGHKDNYDLSQSSDLTLFLIWNIRHVLTHNGGLIDQSCKDKHRKIMSSSRDVKPVIDLPMGLEIGHEFVIGHDDYYSIKKCVFQYLEERICKEDLEILSTRSSITDLKVTRCEISMVLGNGNLIFDLAEAYDYGFSIDPKTKMVNTPPNTEYDFEKKLIILADGRTFPARYVRDIPVDQYFIKCVPNTRIDISKLYSN